MEATVPGFKIPVTDKCGDQGDLTGPSNVIETARKHRYRIEVLGPLGDTTSGLLLFGHKCTRPTIELDEVTIHNSQDEIFRPGKQHWKTVEFTFYEKIFGTLQAFNQAAELAYEWWGFTMIDLNTSLHNEPSTYLKNCQLDMLDGNGNTVWSYNLYDCWPSKISPSHLDYSDSAIADITLTLRYSKAKEARQTNSGSSSTSTMRSSRR